jgi:hypothetical protein
MKIVFKKMSGQILLFFSYSTEQTTTMDFLLRTILEIEVVCSLEADNE